MIKMEIFNAVLTDTAMKEINTFFEAGNRELINIQLSDNPISGSNNPLRFIVFYEEEEKNKKENEKNKKERWFF